MTPFVAELIGTAFLLTLGGGVVANVVLPGTKGHGSGWMVITTAWALAVYVAVVVAAPSSGAHLNPAVTVGLAVGGRFAWSAVPLYVTAQLLGAFIGAVLTWLLYRDHFRACDDAGAKLAVFATAPAIRNPVSNVLSEAVGTFALVFTIFFFADATFELDDTPTTIGLGSIGALPVALLVWVIGLALGGTTGYAINPARDFAPRLAHALLPISGKGSSDWGYAWVPVVGPLLGAVAAALLAGAVG